MPKLSLILPCQNEESSLETVILQAKEVLKKYSVEIIISDSSTDNSPNIANKHQVHLVKHDMDGYGRALLEGFKQARGTYLIFADADGSYDMKDIPFFINKLEEGYDFVIGNRFSPKLGENSMPFLHRYLGNPFLSWLLKMAYGSPFTDAQCGMRAITKEALHKLSLQSVGMEFASEMVIMAIQNNLHMTEVPIHYHARMGRSKLRPWSDGLRHVRLIIQNRV